MPSVRQLACAPSFLEPEELMVLRTMFTSLWSLPMLYCADHLRIGQCVRQAWGVSAYFREAGGILMALYTDLLSHVSSTSGIVRTLRSAARGRGHTPDRWARAGLYIVPLCVGLFFWGCGGIA